MAEITVIIPARWGSTRFPGKPLHMIAGKPLIQHVWEGCRAARGIEEVIVATDDMRIAEAAFNFGADVALTSTRHQSGTDRIAEVARKMRRLSHIINVQGDEPLIAPALITRLARELSADNQIKMITAATPIAADEPVDNPNAVKVVLDRESNALYFSRSVIPFFRKNATRHYRHLGIYGYTRKFLLQFVRWRQTPLERTEQLEQLRALEHGAKIRVVVTNSAAPGVDTPEDVELVEKRMM
jgi:3-deoxy-manno-octulosonate cytidylyltransferase (CMP-KDO synthetase)